MAIQSEIFSTEYGVRSFISTKHIATKQHMSVWLQRRSDNIWVQLSTSNYELINNSAVLTQAPNSTTYSQVEIRVADTPDELGSSQSEIAVLAGLHDEIVALNGIKNDITTVAGISGDVTTVSSNILDINSVVTNIVPNLAEILQADTNATIATTKASEASASAASASSNATIATTKAGEASASATTASTKATEASTSANNALTSEQNADVSEANTLTYKTQAESARDLAISAKDTATTQAGIATTKASEASTSASNALTQANRAQGYADSIAIANIETISELSTINHSVYTTAIVKDLNRGGTFIWSATGTANGGTVFAGVSGFWNRQYSGAVNVKWFGAKGDGVADDTTSINNALRCGYYKVFAPSGTYKTTSPIEIPVLTTFYGDGNATVIKATYSSWFGTDYRAIILETKEGINYSNRDFGKSIRDFSIEGVDSNMVQSIALDFRTKNPNSVVSSTVNFSLYSTFISNIVISRFDTALNIFELWASSFKSIFINECREAIHIEGQAVNNMFSHIQATNFTNSYTISTENTIGISVNGSNRYNGVYHRPEGFAFDSCLIFGAYNNLVIDSCLTFKMDKMILDGGINVCVYLLNPADFTLSNSYIYTLHTEYIRFVGLAVQQTDSVRLINNNFMGKTLSDVGINFVDSGAHRTNITISGNSFYNFGSPIYANRCPNDSIISNNIATGDLSYSLSNRFITVVKGGERTYIDGNRTRENMSIIWTHPSYTSPLLEIGNNSSLNQTTRKVGKVTLPAGSKTVEVPVWTYTDQYVRFITSITCDQITNFKYVPETIWMNGVITIPSALGVNAVFSYTTTTIPYTAS